MLVAGVSSVALMPTPWHRPGAPAQRTARARTARGRCRAGGRAAQTVRPGAEPSRRLSGWDTSTSAPSATTSPTAVPCSTRWTCGSATAPRSRSSGRTARARRRSCGSSPATPTRTAGRSRAAAGSPSCASSSAGSTTTAPSGTCWRRWPRRRSGTPPRSSPPPSSAIMEVDDEPAQMRYATALVDWADVGGYEAEAGWDQVTDAVLVHPVRPGAVPRGPDAVRRRAEAARARGAAARTRGGPPARRAGQLPRRPDQALARARARRDAEDRAVRQPRPRAALPHRDPDRQRRADPGRVDGVGARRRVRDLPRRPARTAAAGSRSCCAAGRSSTPSSRSWSSR